tara:strand:+ start:1007 stop:1174 length:168 start_codon:yes stop_codon:yes gene_type:complete
MNIIEIVEKKINNFINNNEEFINNNNVPFNNNNNEPFNNNNPALTYNINVNFSFL